MNWGKPLKLNGKAQIAANMAKVMSILNGGISVESEAEMLMAA